MKVAFSTYGNSWKEQIDIRFGRAKGFFIVDTETNETQYLDNSSQVNSSQGAGTGAGQALVENGVQALVTGKVGPNAGQVLKVAGVQVYGGIGYTSIEEAYEKYNKGLLTKQEL